ncbi:MAG TPA: sulfatase-like hydrolase/transferase [Candidatus Desulfaltia sp.]|nr:sulfatase-like hydrolase/transferase [Candidatus Desulfaltia sp.]
MTPHTPYEPPPPYSSEYANHPYLGEIAFTDSQVLRLWQFLGANGLDRNSFLIIAGDHGESLGEHEEGSHGFFVYQAAIHVPLIFTVPFGRFHGLSSARVTTLADILPTVCELAGLPIPEEVQGKSLLTFFYRPGRENGSLA